MKCKDCGHDDKLHTDAGCTHEPFCGCFASGEHIRNQSVLSDIYQDQAQAWQEVIDFCRELGANSNHGNSGISMVKGFILELYQRAETYKLMKKFIRNERRLINVSKPTDNHNQ